MNRLFTAFFCVLLVACSSRESAEFVPPRFVSTESEQTGRNVVTLRCTLSDNRVETCGFLYGTGDVPDVRVECELSGLSFDADISGISDDVEYTWCAFAAAGGVEIQSPVSTFRLDLGAPVPIEDPAFKNWLLSNGFDTDGDGEISYAEAQWVTAIGISPTEKYNLQSLKGIEYMPNLTEIRCYGSWWDNNSTPEGNYYRSLNYHLSDCWGPIGTLRYLDVSHNPKLRVLDIFNNAALGEEIVTLDLSNNSELQILRIPMTWLEYPDVSGNTQLRELDLGNCRVGTMTAPDLSRLDKLELLCVDFPQGGNMADLDLSHNTELRYLNVNANANSISDLSNNPKLIQLQVSYRPDLASSVIPCLPNLPNLEILECIQLGLSGTLDLSGNTKLRKLDCRFNNLRTLDVSENLNLGQGPSGRLWCVQVDDLLGVNYLETLYVAKGQVIPFINDGNRSEEFIPATTQIVVKAPDAGNYPPENEIWYTTVSGRCLVVNPDFCEGVYLVSNTYESGLGVLTFNGPVSTVREYGIYFNYDLESLVLPSGIKETSYSCFRENMHLRRVEFAPGLIVLGDSSLHHNEGLQEVLLPDTCIAIEKDALSHAYSLVDIVLPPYLERLGRSAFLYCHLLRSIVLPETMKYIGIYAFEHDTMLESITCLAPKPPIGGIEMFDDTGECPIYVPAASVEAYRTAPIWENYSHRIKAIGE